MFSEILKGADLEMTSRKTVVTKLEKKLGVDLTEKKKLIFELVMEYVNEKDESDDAEEASEEEEEEEVLKYIFTLLFNI